MAFLAGEALAIGSELLLGSEVAATSAEVGTAVGGFTEGILGTELSGLLGFGARQATQQTIMGGIGNTARNIANPVGTKESPVDTASREAFLNEIARQSVRDYAKYGKDTGEFATQLASKSAIFAGLNITELVNLVVGDSPALAYLAPGIQAKLASFQVPNTEDYRKVAEVYNGKNLNWRNVLETEYSFSGLDETGKVHTWKKDWNKNYQHVPPIYGTWVGINSPNDRKPSSLLDYFAMLHDISYHYEPFNEFGDYQLISRCLNNLDRMEYDERQVAVTAIKYFATLGSIMRKLKGSKGGLMDQGETFSATDPTPPVPTDPTQRFSTTNIGGLTTIQPGEGAINDSLDDSIFPQIIPDAGNLPEADYSEAKNNFFEGLQKGIEERSINSSVIANVSIARNNNQFVTDLLNIEIEPI